MTYHSRWCVNCRCDDEVEKTHGKESQPSRSPQLGLMLGIIVDEILFSFGFFEVMRLDNIFLIEGKHRLNFAFVLRGRGRHGR